MSNRKSKKISSIIEDDITLSPLFATTCGIVAKQIQTLESIRLHPILIVVSPHTVLFICQVGEPLRRVACIGAPNIFSLGRCIWPIEDRPWKWRMGIIALLQTC